MPTNAPKKIKLSHRKELLYKQNAKAIKFLRRNPIIACELILGIKLMDSQKWILQHIWNTKYNNITASRNFGKSFLIAVVAVLKSLLYPDGEVYIISSVGSQAQETFMKIEKLAKQRIASIPSLKDIFYDEVVKKGAHDGFSHDKQSYSYSLHNGSAVFTLNSKPDNNRGKRAIFVFIDESAFTDDELIIAVRPFIAQDTNFKLSVDEEFDHNVLKKEVPTQILYSSSANGKEGLHYETYCEYSKRMLAGDTNYFVADIPCDLPLAPYVDGEKAPPLLTQQQIDDDMRLNPQKAEREYYNKYLSDGGESQMIKWAQIRRNETFMLPKMASTNKNETYAIAFDPARTNDNSIVAVMEIKRDDEIGYYGEIVNCVNLIDLAKKKKMQMKSPEQIKYIKQMILDYNGDVGDYYNIESFSIDSGSGGGGITAYADNLLDDWYDSEGKKHKGFIDTSSDLYADDKHNYPNASDKLDLISPSKWRTIMCEELDELMKLDLIKFPHEYSGKGFISEQKRNGELVERNLSMEEEIALMNIDAMKSEATSIHKFSNASGTSVQYKLPKEKERRMHDDRFYTLLMLAHCLYNLRRNDNLNRNKQDDDWDDYLVFGW